MLRKIFLAPNILTPSFYSLLEHFRKFCVCVSLVVLPWALQGPEWIRNIDCTFMHTLTLAKLWKSRGISSGESYRRLTHNNVFMRLLFYCVELKTTLYFGSHLGTSLTERNSQDYFRKRQQWWQIVLDRRKYFEED